MHREKDHLTEKLPLVSTTSDEICLKSAERLGLLGVSNTANINNTNSSSPAAGFSSPSSSSSSPIVEPPSHTPSVSSPVTFENPHVPRLGPPEKLYRRAIWTTVPLFMGYSGMIVLQSGLKDRLGIATGSHEAFLFGLGVGFLYIGNLIFRLLHNVIFTFLKPKDRVVLSYLTMVLALLTLIIPYYLVGAKHIAWVFIAYMVSGVSIGTFESNLISTITPLGHGTKSWAVIGIPLGFNTVSIGSFVLFAAVPHNDHLQLAIYCVIAVMNVLGLFLFYFSIPKIEFEASSDTVHVFFKDLRTWRDWLPKILRHCIALMFDMFCVSLFAAIALYIYDKDEIPLYPYATKTVPRNAFQSIYYTFSFCGDFFSRRIAYRDRERNPFIFLILSVIGFGLVCSKTCLVAPVGMFCVMFANGSIYAQTTRFVDIHVEKKYNLIALSMWLFIGDIGSFVGSQATQALRSGLGDVPSAPMPIPANVTHAPNGSYSFF